MGTRPTQKICLVCVALVSSALCGASACVDDNDLGKYCFVGSGDDDPLLIADPWNTPGCNTGLCLKQGGYKCAEGVVDCTDVPDDQEKIRPICTRSCSTHADCKVSSDNVNGCETFACQRSDPVGGPPVDCHCVCLDFIRDADGMSLTLEAFDASDLSCSAP